ncbi:pyridoxamine 5'-phosphate oxidase family protein [Yoonia sp. SDW83-1]|uniref:pyridoxamine 5'-phosphate oxidase family protein n=1 Tax=Yoonia sp. SDW83-1 TaxID=3366945 RepID=UPI00398C6DE7
MTDKTQRFWDILESMRVCMVTTQDGEVMRSRPMAPYISKLDRTIQFVTDSESAKIYELRQDQDIALSFVDADSMVFVSVSGKGRVNRDRARIREMWGPYCQVFFGDDPDSADVAIIEVNATQAEYWDNDKGKLSTAIEMTRAYFSDDGPNLGENEKLNLAG